MPGIRFHGVSFRYPSTQPILEEASFHLSEGWTGLVGENGCGKSTLLNLISGELPSDRGRIQIEPRTSSIHFCAQELPQPDAFLSALAQSEDGTALRLHGLLGLNPSQLLRWNSLSPGERKRWQVGAALYADADILLLDEPTNHVDAETRDLLAQSLRHFSGLGIVVSHDRSFLEALTQRTLWLESGVISLYDCSYGGARSLREQDRAHRIEEREGAKRKAKQLERQLDDARRRQSSASRSRSLRNADPKDSDARTMGARNLKAWAEDRLGSQVHKLRHDAERAQSEIPEVDTRKSLGRSVFFGYQQPERDVLLDVHTDSLQVPGKVLLRNVSLTLRRGARIHLQGQNGSGKSTLIRAALTASRLPMNKCLVLSQEHSHDQIRAMLTQLRDCHPEERGRISTLLAALGMDPGKLSHASTLSPGEARKLEIAIGLARHVWLLVLDEPTNHLDLPSVERLGDALAAFPGAILLVTHDRMFARQCTTTALRIEAECLRESSI